MMPASSSTTPKPAQNPDRAQNTLTDGEWHQTKVKEWTLDAPNPEAEAHQLDQLQLPTELTADRIRDGFGSPQAIPIWELPAYIAG